MTQQATFAPNQGTETTKTAAAAAASAQHAANFGSSHKLGKTQDKGPTSLESAIKAAFSTTPANTMNDIDARRATTVAAAKAASNDAKEVIRLHPALMPYPARFLTPFLDDRSPPPISPPPTLPKVPTPSLPAPPTKRLARLHRRLLPPQTSMLSSALSISPPP